MNSEYEACTQWITAARETQRIVTQTTENNRDDQREKVISFSLSTTIAGYSYERKRFNRRLDGDGNGNKRPNHSPQNRTCEKPG